MLKTLKSEIVYKNNWVSVFKDDVEFPDGSIGEYGVVRHHSKSVVVLVEANDKILFVNANRYVNKSISIELPAGIIEKGETPIEASCREVLEETGCVLNDCIEMFQYLPSNGTSDQVIYVVKGRCTDMNVVPDNNEVADVMWMSNKEIEEKIIDNTIDDGPTLIAWLYYKFCCLK